jgi:hypothetical protein
MEWGSVAAWASGICSILALIVSVLSLRRSIKADMKAEAGRVLVWIARESDKGGVLNVQNRSGRLINKPTAVIVGVGHDFERWQLIADALAPDEKYSLEFDLERLHIRRFSYLDYDGCIWIKDIDTGDLVRVGDQRRVFGTVLIDLLTGLRKHRKLGQMKRNDYSRNRRLAYLADPTKSPIPSGSRFRESEDMALPISDTPRNGRPRRAKKR